MARARGDISGRERRASAELVLARRRAASGHGRVVGVLLMRRKRMAVGVRAMKAFRHDQPRVVRGAVEIVSPAAVVVEVVVHLLRKRPHHGIRAETRHPVAREAVNRGGIVGELLVHRRGEEELGVRMDEAPVGDVLVVAVGELEAGNIGCVHLAVRDVELRADGLGLEHGEALRRTPIDDVLEVGRRTRRARVRPRLVDLLLVEAPVRVAEVEERSAVRVGEVLRALRRLHESAPVDLEVARVGLCLQRA